jgi:RecA-family ATPase
MRAEPKSDDEIRAELDGLPVKPPVRPNGHAGAEGTPADWRARLQVSCAADLEGKPVQPRRWVVPEWVPARHLTGMYGRGGIGKTTLAVQLNCAAAVGGHWLGMPVRKSRPFAFLCEDDEDEIERKIYDAANCYNIKRSDLKDFDYSARLGKDNLLFVRSGRGGLETTQVYEDLCQMVGDTRRDMLTFDGIPDIYGLSINDQGEVTWALGKLLAMGNPTRAAVVLLGHPNKAGTSEFTGCAAWENKPRARLYVGPPKKDGDSEDESDLNDPRRILARSKSNMSGKDAMSIVWRQGAFRADDPTLMTMHEKCELSARQAAARDAFLAALDQLNGQGRNCSHHPSAKNHGPKLMRDAGLVQGFSPKELAQAMNDLLSEGRLKANAAAGWSEGRNRLFGLARTGG